nr:hypothetical protein [Tanacetum cinerariifolium]
MTSFGYRSNPRYAIKECSSCGTLCGYLVDGPNCQGCALLRQELEENLVTYSPDFQNSSEPSNASTNVVNAPREPYIVKQDNGSFVDEIVFDLNRTLDSPDQFHCFHCKDVLRDGEACKRLFSKLLHKVLRISTIVAMSVRIEEEQTAKAQNWKFPVCYDDDDDEEGYNSLNDNIISELPSYSAVTPTEPIDSLSMGDEHLDTILAMESEEFIKSCVENLVPNPSESKGENGCDVLAGFTTFSNVLFDDYYDFDSSNDQSLSVEDV